MMGSAMLPQTHSSMHPPHCSQWATQPWWPPQQHLYNFTTNGYFPSSQAPPPGVDPRFERIRARIELE
eukprot:4116652-Pleurochrysis_carterae.AAC.1